MFANYLQGANCVVILIQKMSHAFNAWNPLKNLHQLCIRHVVNQDQKNVVKSIQSLIQLKLILTHADRILWIAQLLREDLEYQMLKWLDLMRKINMIK